MRRMVGATATCCRSTGGSRQGLDVNPQVDRRMIAKFLSKDDHEQIQWHLQVSIDWLASKSNASEASPRSKRGSSNAQRRQPASGHPSILYCPIIVPDLEIAPGLFLPPPQKQSRDFVSSHANHRGGQRIRDRRMGPGPGGKMLYRQIDVDVSHSGWASGQSSPWIDVLTSSYGLHSMHKRLSLIMKAFMSRWNPQET